MVGTSNFTLYTSHSAEGRSCETKPICFGSDTSQVPCGTAVTSDSAPGGLQKTNPINAAPRGTVIPSASFSGQALPVNPEHGQDAHATHGRDGRATGTPNAVIRVWEPIHGRDAHATVPPDGGTTDAVEGQGQSCETNPIRSAPNESQVHYGKQFRDDSARHGLEKTKPIDGGVSSVKFPVSSRGNRWPELHTSHFKLETAAQPRQTNPICRGRKWAITIVPARG